MRLSLFLLLLTPLLSAQSPPQTQSGPPYIFEQVNAGQLRDQFGNLIASGQMCFLGTDTSNNPITYTPQGFSAISTAQCSAVSNGIVTNLFVANPAYTNPTTLRFRVTIISGVTTIQTIPLVALLNAPVVFWDSYVIQAVNVGYTGLGVPRNACFPGAFYLQTDSTYSNPNWQCGSGGAWAPLGVAPPPSSGFSTITGGTNTTALHIGSGGTLDAIGNGTITATDMQYNQGGTGALPTTLVAKTRKEQLSLTDFCDSTGVTPITSTLCFTDARIVGAALGQQIKVPPGTYLVDGQLTISSTMQLTCDSGAIFKRGFNGSPFVLASSNITISNCQGDGQYSQSGYTADFITEANAGSFQNWTLDNLRISNTGGKTLMLGFNGATISGVHINGGTFTGSAYDNGGGVVTFAQNMSNVLMDGNWTINQTNEFATPSTDGLQMFANVSSGTHPLRNITVKDGVINYVGGKIPIEMGNYCGNPCNFYAGPIMIDNVTINALYSNAHHGYGSGISWGNGIGYSTFQNSTVNMSGDGQVGPSQCVEIAQDSYNTVFNNNLPCAAEVNAGGSYNRITGNRITVALPGQNAIYLGDTQWSEHTNWNTVDNNIITMTATQTSAAPAIFMQNNTQVAGSGQWHEDHNTIHDNKITYTDASCQASTVYCLAVYLENDGTTGGMSYNTFANNHVYGSSYPFAFNSSALIFHSQFFGNIYDTSNFNAFIGQQTATNTDIVADAGTGSTSWSIKGGLAVTGALSASALNCPAGSPTLTIAVGSNAGTGATASLFSGSCNMHGTVQINAGTSPPGSAGNLANITFNPVVNRTCLLTNNQNGNTTVVNQLQAGNPAGQLAINGFFTVASGVYFINYICF